MVAQNLGQLTQQTDSILQYLYIVEKILVG